jgi:nitric oxide reductase NorD protein
MLIDRLRRQFAALRSELLRLHRQPVGPDLDLDAVIDAEVRRRMGQIPVEAIYTDTRRDLHDVAAIILLDQSYSTDAWLDGARVLDLIIEATLCTGEVLDDFVEKFAIAGFSSNTRRACHFSLLKDFREPWSSTRDRLGTVEASGYTRIGPALRHAQELLEKERARRKLVLLFTDGRPCDYDRYEGQHGIHDVKKAIETGRLRGIQTEAFAIDKQAAAHLPAMFTHRGYHVVPNPSKLTGAMCHVFARLLAG